MEGGGERKALEHGRHLACACGEKAWEASCFGWSRKTLSLALRQFLLPASNNPCRKSRVLSSAEDSWKVPLASTALGRSLRDELSEMEHSAGLVAHVPGVNESAVEVSGCSTNLFNASIVLEYNFLLGQQYFDSNRANCLVNGSKNLPCLK